MLDIHRYCYPPDEPAALAPSFPFQDEGVLIACSGAMVLATTDWQGPQRPAPQGYEGILSRLQAMPRTGRPVPIRSLQLPEPKPCIHCLGVGRLLVEECLGCDGQGQFDHGGQAYRCAVCGGRGEVFEPIREAADVSRRCWYCFGSGEQHEAVPVGPGLYEARQLRMLRTLPDCQLEPEGGDTPARFTFTRGWGFLVPTVAAWDLRLLSAAYESGFARAPGFEARVPAEQLEGQP